VITIEKEVKIIIDGDDVETLRTICEWARAYAATREYKHNGENWIGAYSQKEAAVMLDMMDKIFIA